MNVRALAARISREWVYVADDWAELRESYIQGSNPGEQCENCGAGGLIIEGVFVKCGGDEFDARDVDPETAERWITEDGYRREGSTLIMPPCGARYPITEHVFYE